jgi:hypothetical protein
MGFALAVSASQMFGVGVGKKVEDRCAVAVYFLQPRLRGLLLVSAVDPPVVDEVKIALKIEQQVVAGHNPTGEKMLCHPVGGVADLERKYRASPRPDGHTGCDPESEASGQRIAVPMW